jgi:4-hydroxybenzoyl-CoA reductase subunit beta
MKRRHQTAKNIVSLMEIPGISEISHNGECRIGATALLDDITRNSAIQHGYPALARAIASISSPPLRNMGTIGGNLCLDTRCTYYNQTEEWRRSIDYCMKEAGTVCWVAPSSPRCWAHSASDSAPILCALGARVRLVSEAGDRVIPVDELFVDDGIEYLSKRPDEILTEILLSPDTHSDRCRSSFWKLRRRGSIDFAVLSVAAAVQLDATGVVEKARIYLGSVGSMPLPASAAEQYLAGKRLTPEVIEEAARLAREPATPMDNTDFKAQWRGAMVSQYAGAALREIAGLEQQTMAPKHPIT